MTTTTRTTSTIRVAIVGGGPSGLTLACILKALSIPFTLYELDSSPSARTQGGMLDIHRTSGQLALAKAGLLEEFKRRMRIDATAWTIRDHKGKVYWNHTEAEEEDPERPEIDRGDLRDMLLGPLGEEEVKWGKKLIRAEKLPTDGKFQLHFADGTKEEGFNILIGADGTWSRVRPLRSDLNPPYIGMSVLVTNISQIDTRFPKLAEYVGNGTCMLMDGQVAICAQRSGDGSIKSYSFIPVPEEWKDECGMDWEGDQKAALKEYVERFYGGWAQEPKDLLLECDEGELTVRRLYQFLPDHKLEKECSGVTVLGDAAHVITPFTGTGVNLAMHDAYDLGVALESIAFEGADIDGTLTKYENAILERASGHSAQCLECQEAWYTGKTGEEAIHYMAKMFGWTD